MSLRTTIKFFTLVFVGVTVPHFARADYTVDRLMASYVIAKAEVEHSPSTEEDAKSHPYTVQVASYINEKDAISHLDELKPQVNGQKLRYFPSFVHGQVWYKVCVGEFVSKDEAETFKKDFVKKTDEPFAVVISLLDRPKMEKSSEPAANADATAAADKKRKPSSVDDATAANQGGDALQSVPTFKKANMAAVDADGGSDSAVAPAKAKVKAKVAPQAPASPAVTDDKFSADDVKPKVKHPAERHTSAVVEGFYSLQVGSYPTEAAAKEGLGKMDKKSDSYVESAMVNGKPWYRIYVGKFKSKKDADEFQKTLTGQSFVRHVTK